MYDVLLGIIFGFAIVLAVGVNVGFVIWAYQIFKGEWGY